MSLPPTEFEHALRRFYDDRFECGTFDTATGSWLFFKNGLPAGEFYMITYGMNSLMCIDFMYDKKIANDSGAKPVKTVRHIPRQNK